MTGRLRLLPDTAVPSAQIPPTEVVLPFSLPAGAGKNSTAAPGAVYARAICGAANKPSAVAASNMNLVRFMMVFPVVKRLDD